MAHGTPDWQSLRGGTLVTRSSDMNELAARLGSPVVFDRQGDVVLADSFDGGLSAWTVVTNGAASYVDAVTNTSLHGASAVKVYSDTAVANYAQLSYSLATPVLSRAGISVLAQAIEAGTRFSIRIDHYDTVNILRFRVDYDITTESLYVYDSSGTPVLLASAPAGVGGFRFWTFIKLVVDLASNKYTRLQFGRYSYDISSYAAQLLPGFVFDQISVTLRCDRVSALPSSVYVDSAIVTINEP